LTAPSFGPVHLSREKDGRPLRCRPRRRIEICPHGLRMSCPDRHARDDARLGEPLCRDCYDYTGSVLFNACAPELWRRFTITLRRTLARQAGLTNKALAAQLRVSFAKVAEYQRRGVVHFHAIIRLDGPAGPTSAPPTWATVALLTSAIAQAAGAVHLDTTAAPGLPVRTLAWGREHDTRPITTTGNLTDTRVAAYVAKYATKAAECNGTGLSHRTVTYVHAVLRKAFRDAVVVEQLLPSNPIERAKRPRKTVAEPGTIWHPAQLAAFLATAQGHRLFAFYHLAAYTGARRGELLNLRWRDIDLDAPQIRITGSATVIAGKRIEGTTKSGRSRTISLDADTAQVLRDHWKRQAQDRLKAGPDWKGTDDYVFRTAWGEPIHPDTVSSLMATLIKAHNDKHPDNALPHARLHDLRHVHATTLLLAGTQVHVVAARLGHADPSITLRVYAHVISNQLAEAADIFAQVIKAAG
ncbi:MAG TPA: site-specific integrase, partial [Arthrobacter sp.]|nr:site-specific integrase [Arthrobacter sp.]